MQYIFAIIFAWLTFLSTMTPVEAVSINANFPLEINKNNTSTTIKGQICFGSTLRTGSELVKIWVSSDSGARNIVSNIVSMNLSSDASYPANCVNPNSNNESSLDNSVAQKSGSGIFSLNIANEKLNDTCQVYYLNFDSNRQGKRNAFYRIQLARNSSCNPASTPTLAPATPSLTPLPNPLSGTCGQECRASGLRCNAGLYCITEPNGRSGCFNDVSCPPNSPTLPICPISPSVSVSPSTAPIASLIPSSIPSSAPSPTQVIPPSATPTTTASSSPTPSPSLSPSLTQLPSNTPAPSCNQECATSLPACALGYFCYQNSSSARGTCQNYSDCKPNISCLPSPTIAPIAQISPPSIANCSSCQAKNLKYLCEKNENDTPPSIYCNANDESILTPRRTISCYSCQSIANSCPFYAQAQVLVQHTLSNGNNVYLPLNINQKDTSWYAMNDRQIAKNPNYSPKDTSNGTDNPLGFTFGKITASQDRLSFPLPATEPNPLYRYNQFGDRASVKLFYPKTEFEIVGQYCQNLGSRASCPPNLSNKQIDSNSDIFSPLVLDCETNIRYGWIMKQKPRNTSQNPPVSLVPNIVPAKAPDFSSSLSSQIEGFATGTTGGDGPQSKLYLVSDFSDDPKNPAPGSLRHALNDPSAKVVQFARSGTIILKEDINLNSNTTIDGTKQDVIITQKGFRLKNIKNVIINKLTMRDCKNDNGTSGDAISIGGSENIFLHRLNLSNYCDGLVDIYDGSTDITLSWSHLSNHVKAILISNDEQTSVIDRNIRVTLHHNFFENLDQRIPRVRYGKVDMYNNFVKNWGNYAIGSTLDSQILVERNIFEDFDAKKNSLIEYKLNENPQQEDEYFMGFVKLVNNRLEPSDFTSKERLPENVFLRPYKATISDPDSNLQNIIQSFAGK